MFAAESTAHQNGVAAMAVKSFIKSTGIAAMAAGMAFAVVPGVAFAQPGNGNGNQGWSDSSKPAGNGNHGNGQNRSSNASRGNNHGGGGERPVSAPQSRNGRWGERPT